MFYLNNYTLILISMSKKKKKEYPRFSINRFKKEWPFSLTLAEDVFRLNQHALYASLRDFFVYTALDLVEEESDSSGEETYFSNSDKNKIIEETGVWDISKYPGFFIKNNKVHYKETRKSKVEKSTKEELTINIYTLDHIPYETIICEGTKFYINHFFQGSVVNFDGVCLNLLSLSSIWTPIFQYLLWTTCSSSMKKMLDNQNYIKNYKRDILPSFYGEFKLIKSSKFRLNKIKILAETKRSVFEERLLNVFLFSGISENTSKTLINNFFLTKSLDEILSFYQELLSPFET